MAAPQPLPNIARMLLMTSKARWPESIAPLSEVIAIRTSGAGRDNHSSAADALMFAAETWLPNLMRNRSSHRLHRHQPGISFLVAQGTGNSQPCIEAVRFRDEREHDDQMGKQE